MSAIVTGAGGGIGAAIARRLAGAGRRVAICDIDGTRARAVAAELGEGSFATALDVRDRERVAAFVDDAASRFGGIDIVCANAGIAKPDAPLEHWRLSDIDEVIDVNLKGVVHTIATAIPQLRDGASVVITASTSGLQAQPGAAVYSATKTALIGLARSTAIELAPRGIRVNCVCPGGVDTPLVHALVADMAEVADEYRQNNPLGRMATPEDIAGAVAFLASEDASYITGVALRVDGGDTLMGAI